MKNYFIYLFLFLFISSCTSKKKPLFTLLDSKDTGIDFVNTIFENDTFNILTYEYIYNGGGVAIADFNNDSLQDVFFSGNQVANSLFINQGGLKFKDVSDKANISIGGRWNSGVSAVDINNDGWMDIYVCATKNSYNDERRNCLFVNQGKDEEGNIHFLEQAADYNLDYSGYTVSAAFFDYDKDGDLDLYLLQNVKTFQDPGSYRKKIVDGSATNNDRLLRNEGGMFKDVSQEAGITYEGFGLGLSIADFNLDGWPDIYVSNDYISNDILYLNQKDGTFINSTRQYIGHQSQFSMGNDAADFNNDGLVDIITLDMLPETNSRKKTTIGNKSYQTYVFNETYQYEYQYVRNMLQLNNGLNQNVKFSEIGQLAGVYQTEWSWSPLFADFDNDGNKDIFITNGFPRDITDKDFANYRVQLLNLASPAFMLDSIPIIKIPNYAFKNNGNLTFSNVSDSWGLNVPSFSSGSAFADLDNDGDLDYVVNNINDKAFVFRNNLNDNKEKSIPIFLDVELKGSLLNKNAIGASVTLYYSGKKQYSEVNPYRGYLSTVQTLVHFGIGNNTSIDSLVIYWPDGFQTTVANPKINRKVLVDYNVDFKVKKNFDNKLTEKIFKHAEKELDLRYKHEERDFIDFDIQRTLPHKFSQYGPSIAVGDINGDKLEDFVIGGSSNFPTTIFVQLKDGQFSRSNLFPPDKQEEDAGILLFDIDQDSDLDIYIVGGSNEHSSMELAFQDYIYINDGKGKFTRSVVPNSNSSGSCVRAADFDGDGDLDVFVGGRVVPDKYPSIPESYLFENINGKLTDVTNQKAPQLAKMGMITDALWTDFNNDKKIDLLVVGEFTPIQFFTYNGKVFEKVTTGIEQSIGWWNSILAGDFDQDGDTDYIVGNLGLNTNFQVSRPYPIKLYAKDFDSNGSIDPILASYVRVSMDQDSKQLYPILFWEELVSQIPGFRKKFLRYKQYGATSMEKLLSGTDTKNMVVLEANEMASCYVENLGNGKMTLTPLEMGAQEAPIFGMVAGYFNDDSFLDIALVGNDYGNEVFAGRYDAFTGLVLLGNGKSFDYTTSAQTGFYVPGNAKGTAILNHQKGSLILATQNQDSLKVFSLKEKSNFGKFTPFSNDVFCTLYFSNKKTQKVEFYYGSGFYSQSSRTILIPPDVDYIVVCNSRGECRTIKEF